MFKSVSQSLHEMIISFIVQSIAMLPEDFSTRLDLSPERIARCIEQSSTTNQRLELLRDLLSISTQPRIWIIDGMQLLEDRANPNHTRDLSQLLDLVCKCCSDDEGGGLRSKCCITTDGYVDALAEKVEEGFVDLLRFELEADERGADETERLDDLDFKRDF